MLTFRSGGWVLCLAGVLCAGVVAWRITVILSARGSHAIGDGVNVESYGFDLSTCLVPRRLIVASGLPKDGTPAFSHPRMLTAAETEALSQQMRAQHQGKLIVGSDRVIGVAIGGDARAYPLRLLAWHQIANDVVGGVPIAVTYDPLCDSAVVFIRRVGGRTIEFGLSGLLFNSNLLMYDREPGDRAESLWSQLQFRAVAGPAAARGESLALVPAEVVGWDDWRREHPQTKLLAPDMGRLKVYKQSFDAYYSDGRLWHPVEPLPPIDGLAWKSPVVAVEADGRWRVLPLARIASQGDERGERRTTPGATEAWRTTFGATEVVFVYRPTPPAVLVRHGNGGDAAPPRAVRALWFAWYAMHPDSELVGR